MLSHLAFHKVIDSGIDLFQGVPLSVIQERAQQVAAFSVTLRPQKLLLGESRRGFRNGSFCHINFLLE